MLGGYVVDKCIGVGFDDDHKKYHKGGRCARTLDGRCLAYLNPELKWDRGPIIAYCPLATHYNEFEIVVKKKRAGQQKQKKRG